MTVSCLHVDFNEMLEPDLVLLSQTDQVVDQEGNIVQLYEGLFISLYSEDFDEQGNPQYKVSMGSFETEEEAQLFISYLKDSEITAKIKRRD